jgi:hypothetical protein
VDTQRFDHIARLIAARRSRRAALGGGFGLAAAAITPLAGRVAAQEATPSAEPDVMTSTDPHPSADALAKTEFLFVQPFASGTWVPKTGEDGTYTLSLSGAPAATVYFSDRPERVFGLAPTERFLDDLGFTAENPPNAALVAVGDGGVEDVAVVELLNPTYDQAASTLTYDAKLLADYGGDGLRHAAQVQVDFAFSEQFAEGSLFIDDCPDNRMSCYASGSYVGWVNVGTCWDWGAPYPACKNCHDPAGYCASAFPHECSGRAQVDQNVYITFNTCEARLDGDSAPM